jgi:RNA polymerase-binding transcription factor
MGNLSAEQLAELKLRLEQRRAHLQDEIREELVRSDEEHYIDLAGKVHDVGEQSVADLLADFSIALIDRQVSELAEVEAALKRIAMGSYGECIECGGDIGYERLSAYPTAKRDIACQEVFEKTYAREGNPTL